jgi:hypothetical protein
LIAVVVLCKVVIASQEKVVQATLVSPTRAAMTARGG